MRFRMSPVMGFRRALARLACYFPRLGHDYTEPIIHIQRATVDRVFRLSEKIKLSNVPVPKPCPQGHYMITHDENCCVSVELLRDPAFEACHLRKLLHFGSIQTPLVEERERETETERERERAGERDTHTHTIYIYIYIYMYKYI